MGSGVERGTNLAIHERAVRRCVDYLRKRGQRVSVQPRYAPWDFEVNDQCVAVRVGRPVRRTIRLRIRGKDYTYQYRLYHWNLHRHGRPLRGIDAVICVAKSGRAHVFFVIPWKAIHGLTFSVRDPETYHGHYARYLDNFAALEKRAA